MRDVSDQLEYAAMRTNGWLSVEDVRVAGLLPLTVLDGGAKVECIHRINPLTREAEVSNTDRRGMLKMNHTRDEISTRIVRLKNPQYLCP